MSSRSERPTRDTIRKAPAIDRIAPEVSTRYQRASELLDAVLTGAKGINLWSSFRVPPPQRRSRIYRALVDSGLASAVSGGMLPTQHPFVYILSATATSGTPLAAVESRLLQELEVVRQAGVTAAEVAAAKRQLKARLVFDADSVTNIAHQLGYFETIGCRDVYTAAPQRIDAVTAEQVTALAARMLPESNRTVGWFDPLPVQAEETHVVVE